MPVLQEAIANFTFHEFDMLIENLNQEEIYFLIDPPPLTYTPPLNNYYRSLYFCFISLSYDSQHTFKILKSATDNQLLKMSCLLENMLKKKLVG